MVYVLVTAVIGHVARRISRNSNRCERALLSSFLGVKGV